jgi:D-glycero-D-manno-heptose 1,7-bisphosphate phosphatase
MLLQAAAEHDINLATSYMVGDKVADVEAGERVGCTSLLVMTGYGSEEVQKFPEKHLRCFSDLAAATRYILTTSAAPLT